jgi:hypothetical protein
MFALQIVVLQAKIMVIVLLALTLAHQKNLA